MNNREGREEQPAPPGNQELASRMGHLEEMMRLFLAAQGITATQPNQNDFQPGRGRRMEVGQGSAPPPRHDDASEEDHTPASEEDQATVPQTPALGGVGVGQRHESPSEGDQIPGPRGQTYQRAARVVRVQNPRRTDESSDAQQKLAREVENMNRRIEELSRERGSADDVSAVNRHPFDDEIMNEPLPMSFRAPNIDNYDGTSDPMDHLVSFNCSMALQGVTDAILCRAFPATLKGASRAWYSHLKPKSVRNFEDLSRSFLAHFSNNRRRRRTSASLMLMKQAHDEPLKVYLTRFNSAVVEVVDLDQAVAVAAAVNGMRVSRLMYSFHERMPTTLNELRERADNHIEAEEAINLKRQAEKVDSSRKRNEPERVRPRENRGNPVPRLRQVEVTARAPPRE